MLPEKCALRSAVTTRASLLPGQPMPTAAQTAFMRIPSLFMGPKNYILDTNVLLHDPNSLLNFQENDVLIPIEVIEEIDRFKREPSELGQNARSVSRTLDALRHQGHLSKGVALQNGGCLRVVFQEKNGHGPLSIGNGTVDSRILSLALSLTNSHPEGPTILVTKDINLRI